MNTFHFKRKKNVIHLVSDDHLYYRPNAILIFFLFWIVMSFQFATLHIPKEEEICIKFQILRMMLAYQQWRDYINMFHQFRYLLLK